MFGRKNNNYQHYSHPPLYSYYPYQKHQIGGNPPTRTQPYYHPYYPQTSPMYQGSTIPYGHQQSMMGDGGNYGYNQTYPIEAILQNPLQPKKTQGMVGQGNPYMKNNYPYMHPYPKPGYGNRPPTGMNSILNSFKAQDGTFDFNKMIDTAGTMMNAFSQVSGLVKGIGGIFKV